MMIWTSCTNPAGKRLMIVQGIDHLWQDDLSDFSSQKKHNSYNRFFIFIINPVSKYVWTELSKTKHHRLLPKLWKTFLRCHPLRLQMDKDLMKAKTINVYTSQNEETKATFVEHLQCTYKTKMFRFFTVRNTLHYLDVLEDLMHSYYNTVHS